MYIIPNADGLVAFIKDFTGSNNDTEVKQAIFMAEMSMRNVELPALRSDPYAAVNIATADANGRIVIPSNMNKPILFFKQGSPGGSESDTGPWIVYDRIGDRDLIAQSMLNDLYLTPFNVPAVIRGKFSEVGNKYEFLPGLGAGDKVNLYYYKAWPLLFAPMSDIEIGTNCTVSGISGSGPWTATISGLNDINGVLEVGDEIIATDDTGSLGTDGVYTVASIVDDTTITFTATGGTTPIAGNLTCVFLTNQYVENNAVLKTWPEGYVYATLREYYIKRHNDVDAAIYEAKFKQAMDTVEDQNNLGKWSGGSTKLSSIWQPRQYRRYNLR